MLGVVVRISLPHGYMCFAAWGQRSYISRFLSPSPPPPAPQGSHLLNAHVGPDTIPTEVVEGVATEMLESGGPLAPWDLRVCGT